MGRMSCAFDVPDPDPCRDETMGRISWSLPPTEYGGWRSGGRAMGCSGRGL